jgi:hypothetical protein
MGVPTRCSVHSAKTFQPMHEPKTRRFYEPMRVHVEATPMELPWPRAIISSIFPWA